MKLERSDIGYPLWRKKVDATLFKDGATPKPKWQCEVWSINTTFINCYSKKDYNSKTVIYYNKKMYAGNVVQIKNQKMYRLFFERELSDTLKDVYLMSYMRSIEQDLRKGKPEYLGQDIEIEIPFWEFIDIEFNSSKKSFHLKSNYIQKPVYIELLKELVKSHTLKIIDDLFNQKKDFRFVKQDWEERRRLKTQIEAKNVIYNLIDTKNRLIYIGEAENLVQRLNQNRDVIRNWDYYGFDCLPAGLTRTQRVAIERLLIRTFDSFFPNRKGIPSKKVSEYSLANDKIDS